MGTQFVRSFTFFPSNIYPPALLCCIAELDSSLILQMDDKNLIGIILGNFILWKNLVLM